jgi:D-tyrosyl-tRNA(Tyr) deacylase
MRVVLQKVSEARVTVDEILCGEINAGYVLLVAVSPEDTQEDIEWLVRKIAKLKLFGEEHEKCLNELSLDVLIISQFTLFGTVKKGTKPSYSRSANFEFAKEKYNQFLDFSKLHFKGKVNSGVFGANMTVNLKNEGPITLIIDSKNKKL